MLHQDRLSSHNPVLVRSVSLPPMGDAVQCQEVAIFCLNNMSLHWEAILGNETWLWTERREIYNIFPPICHVFWTWLWIETRE